MADGHQPAALALEDIVIPQGATESPSWPAPWAYAEGSPAGPPPGWPGSWLARMQIRDARGEGSLLLATLTSSGTADGTLALSTLTDDGVTFAVITPAIPPAVSAAWTWADTGAVWDLELARVDGSRVIRLVEGAVSLSGEVTQ